MAIAAEVLADYTAIRASPPSGCRGSPASPSGSPRRKPRAAPALRETVAEVERQAGARGAGRAVHAHGARRPHRRGRRRPRHHRLQDQPEPATTWRAVRSSGQAPQLPLEAAIAAAGGFAGVPAGRVTELRYISTSGGEPPGQEIAAQDGDVAALARDGARRPRAPDRRASTSEATPYRAAAPRPLQLRLRRLRASGARRRMVARRRRGGGLSDAAPSAPARPRRRPRARRAATRPPPPTPPPRRGSSANAGTGKTHVLTMRVLRLLLAGTEPAAHPGLTYTKAAAAEMATRVFDTLAEWVTASDAELDSELCRAARPRRRRPRRCSAHASCSRVAIETPGGLKVQTIHAFCERLLQRFPLEAGVPPGLRHPRRSRRAPRCWRRPSTPRWPRPPPPSRRRRSADALAAAIAFAAEMQLRRPAAPTPCASATGSTAARAPAMRRRDARASFADGARGRSTAARSGSAPDASLEATERRARRSCSRQGRARPACATSWPPARNATRRRAEQLAAALAARGAAARIAALAKVFLTTDGEPRKSLMTKGARRRAPRCRGAARARAGALRARCTRSAASCSCWRRPWRCCGSATPSCSATPRPRRAARALDFDDLIAKAASLLARVRRASSGCSTSSTAASTTSWSTRRRTRARCSGR